jgi:hypothetical protein
VQVDVRQDSRSEMRSSDAARLDAMRAQVVVGTDSELNMASTGFGMNQFHRRRQHHHRSILESIRFQKRDVFDPALLISVLLNA